MRERSVALAALAFTVLVVSPAVAETRAPLPLTGSGALHEGDAIVYHRQWWLERENGTVDEAFTVAVVVELRDVRSVRDGDGVSRPTLLLDVARRPLTHTSEGLVDGVHADRVWDAGTLLVDARSGEVFGAYETWPDGESEMLRFGVPGQDPVTWAFGHELPCAVAYLLEVTLARADAAALVSERECAAAGHHVRAGTTPTETTVEAGFANGTRRFEYANGGGNRVVMWTHADAPVPVQFASRTQYGAPDGGRVNLTVVEYVTRHARGDGASLADARAALALPAPLTAPDRAPVTRDGPAAGEDPFPFPLADALHALRTHPDGGFYTDYVTAHPDAVVTHLRYNAWESPNGTWGRRTWEFVWSDSAMVGLHARVNAVHRVVNGTEERLAPTVGPWEHGQGRDYRVHRLGRDDVPNATITLEDAVRLARARFPPGLAEDGLVTFTLDTAVRLGERRVTTGGGYADTPTFHAWTFTIRHLEILWNGTHPERMAGDRQFAVRLDATTGRVVEVSAGGDRVPFTPVLDGGATPFYDAPGDALPTTLTGTAAPRYDTQPTVSGLPARIAGVAVAAAAGGVAVAAAATATGRDLVTRVVLAPLYARFARDRVLDHPTRQRIVSALRDHPVRGIADLREALGVPESTIRHHVRVLKRHRVLREVPTPGRPAFALVGDTPPDAARRAALLRHPHARAVYARVRDRPGGATLREVADEVGLGTGAAHHHLTRLAAGGVVRARRSSDGVRWLDAKAPE